MRKENWPSLLNEAIEEHRHEFFGYGEFDCAIFCAHCIDAMTGADLRSELERQYTDVRSAIRFLRRGGDFASLISEFLESDPISVKKAKRGDVVLFDDKGIRAYSAMCVGSLSVTASNPRGISSRPTLEAAFAWRVI